MECTLKESKNDLGGNGFRAAADPFVKVHARTHTTPEWARWDEIEQESLDSLATFRAIYGTDSPDAANISNYLARIAELRMHFATAEQHARRAWEIMERLGDRCDDRKANSVRIEALIRIGTSLQAAGYYDEADIWLQRALDLAERNGLETVTTLNNFGVLCKCRGRFDEAEQVYRRALELVEDFDSGMAATLYHNVGELAHLQKRFAEGEWFGRRAWEIRRRLFGPNHPETLAAVGAYAVLLNGLGRNSESEAILTDALAGFEKSFGSEHLEIAMSLHSLAAIRWARGDVVGADSLYKRAVAIKEKLIGPWHPDTALTLYDYASMLAEMGRDDKARGLASKAVLIFEMRLDPLHPRCVEARDLWELLNTRLSNVFGQCEENTPHVIRKPDTHLDFKSISTVLGRLERAI